MGVDLGGFESLKQKFKDLERRGDGERVYRVSAGAEYAIFWKWVRGICRRTRSSARQFVS
jgi:hypothetical protein